MHVKAVSIYGVCNASALIFNGYAVYDGESYHYYDDSGKKLITTLAKIEWMDYYEEADGKVGHVGYALDKNGNITYYQLSFYTIETFE